jgi:hypothetical protein
MSDSSGHRWVLATLVTAGLASAGIFAATADAKSETLRFFEVAGPTQFDNAAGHPIHLDPPATLPKVGDSFDETNLDYAGTAAHHASHWTASDHLTCTFTSSDTARCDYQIAIGGSLLLGNNFTLQLKNPKAIAPISEGTGAFRGVHGSIVDVDIPHSNNSSLTVHLS